MFLSDTYNNKGTKFYKEVVRILDSWPRISDATLIKDEFGLRAQAVGEDDYVYTLWFANVTKYTATAHLTFDHTSGNGERYPYQNSYSYSEWEILSGLMTPSLAADQILMFLPN